MLDGRLLDDLLAYKIPILFSGDPAQLPPIAGKCPLLEAKPDVMLEEVHRQALESPLLRAATRVRQGKMPDPEVDGEFFKIIRKAEVDFSVCAQYDQTIVGRNATRLQFNSFFAKKKGYPTFDEVKSGAPLAVGESIIFLRNDHKQGIYNGTIGKILNIFVDHAADEFVVDVDCDGTRHSAIGCWPGVIRGEDPFDAPRDIQLIDRSYAITCHKSQGSEWDSVLVYDESEAARGNSRSWLYTALTRAREKCLLVR
jgi:exodeoxyribonuclease-5